MPGGGCALPGLRSYDLSLIYSPLLLKLPVLTASKSLRRSRKAGAARMFRPMQAQRRRARRQARYP
ncbi:LysR family transcriptional regulator [Klebsiella quasipneumoniae]|nr:LysR family transcriptional regulator [Klebsiella quasipneumoniae]